MMDHEHEILLNIEDGEPLQQLMVSQRRSSSKSGMWRICGVLLTVALCAAAAVCFTFNKPENRQNNVSELRHMLRAAPQQKKSTTKDAIHLTGGYNSEETLIEWKDNLDQAFFEGSLKLENNEIIIPNDGIYFIYSQASFHVKCTSVHINQAQNPDHSDEQDIVHLSHGVDRYSESYEDYKSLFKSFRSACVQVEGDSDKVWYSTIYLGAAFRLYTGDRLRTNTTSNELVRIEEGHGKNFLGAFAL